MIVMGGLFCSAVSGGLRVELVRLVVVVPVVMRVRVVCGLPFGMNVLHRINGLRDRVFATGSRRLVQRRGKGRSSKGNPVSRMGSGRRIASNQSSDSGGFATTSPRKWRAEGPPRWAVILGHLLPVRAFVWAEHDRGTI